MTSPSIPRPAAGRPAGSSGRTHVIDLREPTPLQALSIAYADRVAAIGAGAGPADLVALDQSIVELEAACFAEYSLAHRTRLPDASLYLG